MQQFINELSHVFGFKARLKQTKIGGFYIEGPDGQTAPLGTSGYYALLSPRDQEAICENFGLDPRPLGLNHWSD